MKTPATGRAIAAILSDLASVGPFLPGTVRKGGVQYHLNKDGERVAYKAQPRINFRLGGKAVDKRIPFERFEEAKGLAENYKRFKALVKELEAAQVREWLAGGKKNG